MGSAEGIQRRGIVRYRREILLASLAIAAAVLVGGAALWLSRARPPLFRFVAGGSRSTSDGLGISSGNIVVVEGKSGVLFGTVKQPSGPERLTYLIFFKVGPPARHEAENGANFHCSSDGSSAQAEDAIVISGRRVEATYRIVLDKARSGAASETLEVGGRGVDMAAGRVFLVDFTTGTAVYRQREVSLPPSVPALSTTGDVERFAEEIRKDLEGRDSEIRAFVR
jgi:hypothetical protein